MGILSIVVGEECGRVVLTIAWATLRAADVGIINLDKNYIYQTEGAESKAQT